MQDYAALMLREQAAARQQYNYDPRATMMQTRKANTTVETFNSTQPTSQEAIRPGDYLGEPMGSRSDENSVQAAPKTRNFKRYIILDSSQRDWVKQSNPYTALTFTFGSQAIASSNPIVYANNWFVPTFAVEQVSNIPPLVGVPNTRGWTLSLGGSNIMYPAYNSSLPRGQVIGPDTGFVVQPSGKGFGSGNNVSSLLSIRLVRAVLPQRQFLAIPIDPSGTAVDMSTSEFIQSTLVGRPYSTFSTYPYLLFNLNEYFGQYLGGNEQIRRSFSVMTQRQRQQTNFQTNVGVQQYDYEPWGEEALTFQSPITNLKQLEITITDPIGTGFVQTDNLTLSRIEATDNKMYLKCFTGNFQFFSSNELRVGDRVAFYGETLSNMLKSPILSVQDPQKATFITSLSNATFPVLELLDYVLGSNGFYIPRDASRARTTPYVSSYNGFLIPNFVTIGPDGGATPALPLSIDPGTNVVLEPNTLLSYLPTTGSVSNATNLPFLNTSLQPVYTMELETAEPDTSSIGGQIVRPR
jgi:hypothetical protein